MRFDWWGSEREWERLGKSSSHDNRGKRIGCSCKRCRKSAHEEEPPPRRNEYRADYFEKPVQMAFKFDYDKTRMDLLSPLALEEIAKVATMGSKKYGDRNWENGMDYSRVLAALLRHVNAWHSGERTDPESGQSHMAHAAWNAMALVHYERTGAGTDDLPHYGP